MAINYLIGDATQPQGDGNKFIVHIKNNIGVWGAGFVMALSRRWPEPEREYRKLTKEQLTLGTIQLVKVEPDIHVINMIAQEGIRSINDIVPPIRYNALKECLERATLVVMLYNGSIHMPRIGAGLAGGDWNII